MREQCVSAKTLKTLFADYPKSCCLHNLCFSVNFLPGIQLVQSSQKKLKNGQLQCENGELKTFTSFKVDKALLLVL